MMFSFEINKSINDRLSLMNLFHINSILQENEIENPDICNSEEDYVPDKKQCDKVNYAF